MKTPHIHAEFIKAWADGYEIEVLKDDKWLVVPIPFWIEDHQYRIKPEPNPDVVKYATLSSVSSWYFFGEEKEANDNLKLTFDGETGKLKSAEVLK